VNYILYHAAFFAVMNSMINSIFILLSQQRAFCFWYVYFTTKYFIHKYL